MVNLQVCLWSKPAWSFTDPWWAAGTASLLQTLCSPNSALQARAQVGTHLLMSTSTLLTQHGGSSSLAGKQCSYLWFFTPSQPAPAPTLSSASQPLLVGWNRECDKTSDGAGGTICSLSSCCYHLTTFLYETLETQGDHIRSNFQDGCSTGEGTCFVSKSWTYSHQLSFLSYSQVRSRCDIKLDTSGI